VADTKISALSAVGTPTDLDELVLNDGGTSKKMDLNALVAYIESRARVNSAAVTQQVTVAATDVYLAGSACLIPVGRLQAKTMYRCKFNLVKSAAGVGLPVINVRIGTGGVLGDTSRGTLTFPVGTAVADEGCFEITSIFRTVGSGTSAVLHSLAELTHRLSITGLNTGVSPSQIATSGGFDSTVSGLIIGLSVNSGTGATWTINHVQAELWNLA
jgi:hypothetical protein